jgi:lipoprotein signal peptidase
MPDQLPYILMNYGSLALVLAAMVVGVVLTKGTVRTLMAAALAAEVVRIALNITVLAPAYSSDQGAAFYAFSLVQVLLAIAPTLLVVAAAVVGARKSAAKDATISALTDPTTDTWRQPENSPDPKLFVE